MNKVMNICPAGAQKWQGVLDGACRLIADKELKRRGLWAKFVNEYRVRKDGATRAWAGEYWGKMLRGACITYGYTRDEELLGVLTDTVEDMLTTQDELGRFSTYTVDTEFAGWDMWCRKYVLLAMEYYLDICCPEPGLRERIVAACKRHADYILGKIGPGGLDIRKTSADWGAMNSNSILEPMVRLHVLTGEQRYLDFARYIIDCGGCDWCNIFELALENRVYPCQYGVDKAYEMISCFEGICEYYKVTGEDKYLRMAENFFDSMEKSDVTIIGCCGAEGELLNNAACLQSDPSLTDIMQENCVSVTWLKFAERLLEITGKARYADAMERAAYNAVLSAVNLPEKEHPFDSYAALLFSWRGRARGGEKPLADGGSYGCCECIGSAATGLMPLCAVMTDGEGCRVCFYETGRAELPFGALDVSTGYPTEGSVRIRVESDSSFALSLRIPGWCGSASLRLNGEALETEPGWTVIRRKWSRGDLVELEMDMTTRIIRALPGRTEACEEHFALQRGPLALARDARAGGDMVRIYRPAQKDGAVFVRPCINGAFPALLTLEIAEEGGGSFTVSDYASCGKTLDEESLMTCWFPTANWWTPDKLRFYISAGDLYLSPDPEGRLLLSPAKALFEAEPDIAGYHLLRTGDKYLDDYLHAGGAKGRLRLISDREGRWYIVSRNRFASPDGQGGAVLAGEPFRWTLEYAE